MSARFEAITDGDLKTENERLRREVVEWQVALAAVIVKIGGDVFIPESDLLGAYQVQSTRDDRRRGEVVHAKRTDRKVALPPGAN